MVERFKIYQDGEALVLRCPNWPAELGIITLHPGDTYGVVTFEQLVPWVGQRVLIDIEAGTVEAAPPVPLPTAADIAALERKFGLA